MEEIAFTLEPADLTTLHKFLAKRAKAWKLSRYLLLFVVVGSFMFISWTEFRQSHSFNSINRFPLLETVVLPAAIIALFWCYFVFQAKKQSQTNPLFTNPQTLRIGVKELVWQHLGTTTARQWPSITEIASDDASIYFYVGENVEHFVPIRVFPSIEEAQRFQQKALFYWKSPAVETEIAGSTWPPPPRIGN